MQFVKRVFFSDKPVTRAEENVASLMAIPTSLIDAKTRAGYIKRAMEDEDVYAYTAGPDHFWNIWDGATRQRIELGVEK